MQEGWRIYNSDVSGINFVGSVNDKLSLRALGSSTQCPRPKNIDSIS